MRLENITSTLRILGSTTVVGADREQFDFYATEPKAVELLLEEEQFQQKYLRTLLWSQPYNRCTQKQRVSSNYF